MSIFDISLIMISVITPLAFNKDSIFFYSDFLITHTEFCSPNFFSVPQPKGDSDIKISTENQLPVTSN